MEALYVLGYLLAHIVIITALVIGLVKVVAICQSPTRAIGFRRSRGQATTSTAVPDSREPELRWLAFGVGLAFFFGMKAAGATLADWQSGVATNGDTWVFLLCNILISFGIGYLLLQYSNFLENAGLSNRKGRFFVSLSVIILANLIHLYVDAIGYGLAIDRYYASLLSIIVGSGVGVLINAD
ncbi:hypothetical protein ACFU9Y_44340 [Streptomyces sp. NPDC057621]|uniref:hypothetical protein n=1 Tax=Streptomyces sp. NPDC057621 TaxID=3346186 RepID=UPI00367E0AE0